MCGIVGYIGKQNAKEILLEGLRKLEYRGYDSAGIAVLKDGEVQIIRSEGKLRVLESKLKPDSALGHLGIGHTRWATHGRPSETNAHPHKAGPVVLVHNGIIENYLLLRKGLAKKGHTLKSETDTEIVCHLIQQKLYDGLDMPRAFQKALSEIKGSYALVVINQNEPDRIYVARRGSPLVIGLGQGENFVASDVPAILSHTRKVLFLEDGDFGILTASGLDLRDEGGKKVKRAVKEITWNQSMAEKGGFKHFMLKEIFEQPQSIMDTLTGRISETRESRRQILLNGAEALLSRNGRIPYDKVYIIACGTSYHAGLVGKYLLEDLARIPVIVDQASEFRYRNPIIDKKTLVIAVSQSGETADTLAAITDVKSKGARILSICNAIESSIPRASHQTLYTHAGPEIGVASTKAFTTQLMMFLLLAFHLGKVKGTVAPALYREAFDALVKVPDQIEKILKNAPDIKSVAKQYQQARSFLYFGRGVNYPIALEGALKLKEISYIHAEGYPAGEMKHGPIALIDDGMPVVVLAPQDKTYDKVLSNLEEVKARGARVLGVGQAGDKHLAQKSDDAIFIPKAPWYVTPLLLSLPLQMLAYYIADHKGTDVDQPRNLAKSVTVE